MSEILTTFIEAISVTLGVAIIEQNVLGNLDYLPIFIMILVPAVIMDVFLFLKTNESNERGATSDGDIFSQE